jgi:hypothetical protein
LGLPYRRSLSDWATKAKRAGAFPRRRTGAKSGWLWRRFRQFPDRKFSVSLVIPCRNERGNIESAILRMCNCTSEVWSGACHRAAQAPTRWDHPGMTTFTSEVIAPITES